MRIIGGKFKGKRFSPPADKWPTRPTTDFAREALFNILNNNFYFDEISVLDLFGGTGSMTFEFISRGTEDLTYVEKYYPCVQYVKKTINELNAEDDVQIIRGDVFRFLEGCQKKYDIIFADPPYQLPTIDILPHSIFEQQLLKENGLFILEHGNQTPFSLHPNFSEERSYGNTFFSFFKNKEKNDEE